MTRDELIEAGRDAMGRNDGWRWWAPRHLTRLLDVWEPLIRADERERIADADGWCLPAMNDDGECPCDSDMYATGDCPIHDTKEAQP